MENRIASAVAERPRRASSDPTLRDGENPHCPDRCRSEIERAARRRSGASPKPDQSAHQRRVQFRRVISIRNDVTGGQSDLRLDTPDAAVALIGQGAAVLQLVPAVADAHAVKASVRVKARSPA